MAKERKILSSYTRSGGSSVPERMAGKMERVMPKERKILSSYSGGSSVPERMAGKMENCDGEPEEDIE